jgi:hypothetical protein
MLFGHVPGVGALGPAKHALERITVQEVALKAGEYHGSNP